MMRKIACLLFAVLLLSCNDEVVYDKEVRLSFRFPYNGIEGFGNETSLLTDIAFIKKFDKRNYPNLKSIKVSALLRGNPDKAFLELYNSTDDITIENSLMSTSSSEYVWVDSENILAHLPNKAIDLTFAIHSGNISGECGILDAELIMTRN